MIPEDAILGIDKGSTSCRLCLYTLVTHRIIEIECLERADDRNVCEAGDFSSRCYPFASTKVYNGNKADPDSLAASLKPILLLLSGLDESDLHPLILEYPVAQQILDRMDSAWFRRKLQAALAELFGALWKATYAECVKQKVRVTGIGITTPTQWPIKVENFYKTMIEESFPKTNAHLRLSPGSIYFLGETQALAHYLFHHHNNKIWNLAFEEDILLILDFGGQNLNISLYHVDYDTNEHRSFFEIGQSQGFVGGSEQFDYHIGEYCEKFILERDGQTLPPGAKQGLINLFHTKKQKLGPEFEYNDEGGVLMLHWGMYSIHLSPEIIQDAFKKALSGPLEETDYMLTMCADRMRGRGQRGPWAIVTGGTARSKALQLRLESLCAEKGLRKPMFVDDDKNRVSARFPSHSIAKGAAYATANPITVNEFLERSAIGIQMRQTKEYLWDSEGGVLFFQGKTHTRSIQLHYQDELKLICNPSPTGALSQNSIFATTAYDLYSLGFFNRGTLKVSVSLVGGADEISLEVGLSWNPDFPDPKDDKWVDGRVKLPLFADRSSCCMLVDLSLVEQCPPLGSVAPAPDLSQHPPGWEKGVVADGPVTVREAMRRRRVLDQEAVMEWSDDSDTDSSDGGVRRRRWYKGRKDDTYTPANEAKRRRQEKLRRKEAAATRKAQRRGECAKVVTV